MRKNVLYVGNALSNKGKTSTTIDTLSERLSENYVVKIASNKSNKIWRLFDMVFLVLRYQSKTDYVLIDTYSTANFYYAFIISQLCRLFNLRYIPILHGGNLEQRLKHNPKLSGYIFNNAYKLIAPSNFLKTVFNRFGYPDVLFISNTIDIEGYTCLKREIKTINMLWVRSFASIYNPEQAVLVLEQLIRNNYKATLTMVGPDVDGSLIAVKRMAAAKQLDVNFTGKLTKTEWLELSKGSNVFINTTNFDNTPVSVIEAMALGLPVVSTNVGGLPYLISDKEDGLLVPPNNTDAMVNAIIKLKSDEHLKDKLVTAARSKVENFAWDSIKIKWERLLS
ncbi:glycosyltransferase family 4 protein [Winogradskyella sp. F6397]|uniref:Glycosyltransferase family 4 protein n=1 Tax=Winogradskyella marina TaxID=2785530 RepID=A0ABS0EKK2_9FLAO|nr:glycosyltransferase family 4 protein [Winogradskyella marina]MBF8150996.1 glycosyltransferase family 4 protein [Winogradskyella marina]